MSSAAGASASGLPSRRTVLRAGSRLAAGAVTVALGGCGIRLQDDAPDLPLLQRRSIPDEAALIDEFHRATSLSQMAGRIPLPTALVSQLAHIHDTQAQVVHGLLSRGGVPDHVITAAAPTTPTAATTAASATATTAVSAPPPATVAQLTAAEASAVSAQVLAGVAGATEPNRSVLASVAAQRASAAGLLGGTVTWSDGDPLAPPTAARLLEATRPVVYAFEVVAAQLAGDQRPPALATLAALRVREGELTGAAGASATADPLGYALPYPVTSPDLARRLAGEVLTRLVEGGLELIPVLPAGSTSLTAVVRLQSQAQFLAHEWGAVTVPFPGMAYP
ncbi:DUF4439 domain-containing protein [Lapillicoccus sp.]|uniref:DUF4439 domain-containing protein n=1 Tax=Lapillicoccus sp. TaxID=1909287 RepID=UPI003982E106